MTTSVESWSYVFGIVPAGTSLPPTMEGGPLTDLRLVRVAELAAIVGTPPGDRPLGRAADLVAHDRVLAELVRGGTPVLPMRFGAVLSDDGAVAAELLDAHRDDLSAELETVRGRVQYTVKVRYEQDAVLREVLAAHPEIDRLRGGGSPGTAEAFDRQLRLGELVVRAIEDLRPADAARVLDELGTEAEVHVHEPAAPEEVVGASFLVDTRQASEFERRVEAVGKRHSGRLRLRLVGPSPAYDFVGRG